MGQGMIQKLVAVLMDVSSKMGARCDCAGIEKIAVLVHRTMSYQSRQFHTLDHVFGFLDGADARTTLAAIFHDLVYYQVDDGLSPEIEALVGYCVDRREPGIRIADRIPEGDIASRVCMAIFGFEPGSKLSPFAGLNEFLSALAMMKLLEGRVGMIELVAVAACIEASIPFRPRASAPGAALEARLRSLSSSGLVTLDGDSAADFAHRAVAFGNADVRDFALEDPGRFLSNTWKLLPESNAPLRRKGGFTIKEYRVALEKMLAFFRSLDPDSVYHDFGGLPPPDEMEKLRDAVRRNLAYAQTYMKAKLIAVGLLEAVADVSGGDAPMALFMGDLSSEGEERESLMDYLPEIGVPPWLDPENAVYRLLRDGRLDESSFDLKNSPLALHLYQGLKPGAWGALAGSTEEFFAGKIGAEAFLAGFEPEFLALFARACARIAPTRRTALEAWASARALDR